MLNENNELLTGELTNDEFAKWKGVAKSTVVRNKAKYLEELEFFAKFHIEGKRKVIIDEVLMSEYIKQGKLLYNKIKERIPAVFNKNGYDNGSSISNKLEEEFLDIKPSTKYTNVLRGIKEIYPDRKGVWLVKEDDCSVRPLSDEEKVLFKEVFKEHFGDTELKQMIVQGMIDEGELTEEESWSYYKKLIGLNGRTFRKFLKDMRDRLNGESVVKGFYVRPNAFKNIDGGV